MNMTHRANPVLVNARRIANCQDSEKIFVTEAGEYRPGRVYTLEDGAEYFPQPGMLARYDPLIFDYLVTQEDGYEYFNPREVFERKYSPIGD